MQRQTAGAAALIVASCACWGGCSHRVLVPAGDFRVQTPPVDAGEVCGEPLPLQTHDAPGGQLALLTGERTTVGWLAVAGAPSQIAAAALDHGSVAALAAVWPATGGDPAAALLLIQQRLQSFDIEVSTRSSGVTGKLAGAPAIREAVWSLHTAATDAWQLRRLLAASMLGSQPEQLTGWPQPAQAAPTGRAFAVKITLLLWPGQGESAARMAATAALAPVDDFDDPDGPHVAIDDLGNGTALARPQQRAELSCDVVAARGTPMADIIFVVDESGSMNDNRADIVNHANAFFSRSLAAGLDFRVGVAGMKNPARGPILGKLCSYAGDSSEHDGGYDRFLNPDERALFSACVTNPPYFEGLSEFGLTHGLHAVQRHLPRAVGDPTKIRVGAKLALIFVTDEAPQELKIETVYEGQQGFLSNDDVGSCALRQLQRDQLDAYLRPWLDLFSGATDPEAHAMVHVIGGTCINACRAEVAHGYRELAHRLGGQVGDVCQQDIGPTLGLIVESIIAASAQRVLAHQPVSASLVVELNGERLTRRRGRGGFLYNGPANSLIFSGIDVGVDDTVVAIYQRLVSQ